MKMSVILCTYNRCQSLAKTLESPWARTWHFVRKYSESMVVSERTWDVPAESMLGNEDTELGRRLLAGGERLWFEPLAIVYHGIPENRLTKSYFLGFWFNYGRAAVREHANRSNVWKIPRWCFSVPIIIFNVLPARLRLWLFARDSKRRFFCKCMVWRTFGEIFELPRIWLETKRRLKRRTSESSELLSPDVTLGE